ncbi:CRISPR-associated protein Cas4 [Candidatus Bathyarchaeota archaeon]|nr:CRISPR-associated protein Cas4 [Candidatus Bathyarchaeota archaeon]
MKGSILDGEVTVFDIVQYYYCPRKVYFLRVMGVPASIRRKMEYGEEVHEKEKRRMLERKSIYGFPIEEVEEVIQDLQLEAREIGLRGKLDVALRLKNGELIPVDTKYTDEVLIQRQYLKQLYAYALLLEQRYGRKVTRGVIYFSKQMETRVLEVSYEDKQGVLRDIERIRSMIAREATPPAVSHEKCGYCEVKKYCIG